MTIEIFEIKYIGNVKERKGGHRSCFGWIDGEWYAMFTEQVLRDWFNMPSEPTESVTLYSVLGVKEKATTGEIKSQYRRMARQWHPDVCSESDAREQFIAIQNAYDILSKRRGKYDAGLELQRKSGVKNTVPPGTEPYAIFRPPLRCGMLMVEGHEIWRGSKFEIDEIKAWEDITDGKGNVLVTSWRWGDKTFSEMWVNPYQAVP
jgi:hypothetical protein